MRGDNLPVRAVDEGSTTEWPLLESFRKLADSTQLRTVTMVWISGLYRSVAQNIVGLADIDVETSNAIFQALEEWNTLLQVEKTKIFDTPRVPVGPTRRGPSP